MVGQRIKAARKALGMTQQDLSQQIGFKDRQILSNIESGLRKLSSSELLTLMKALKKDLEYFTDPLRLVGEGAFCWRAEAEAGVLDAFEEKAKTWISAYRTLGERLGEPVSPLVPQIPITPRSSYEEAWEVAVRLRREWDLQEDIASAVPRLAEERLKVLVLYVEAPQGISGAACHLGELNTILINRRDPDGRRAYDFAHELFHLLTWQAMPPERIETDDPRKPKVRRMEQLANNFASELLMPREKIEGFWKERGEQEIHHWINSTAKKLGVTAKALRWRLRNLRLLSVVDEQSISDDLLTWNGNVPSRRTLPPLYSRGFVERLQKALDGGFISVRRAAQLLDMTIEDLGDLIESYGLEVPFDL
jgi:Zn-dependent peptidase ImmA (M78 family)/DNA-binding XRE family transcriptional regulator